MRDDIASLYRHRFEKDDLPAKRRIWRVLCRQFFQKFIPVAGSVLDLGCGYGEFINEISAKKKYGVDINPDTPAYLNSEVIHIGAEATRIPLEDASIDVVFTSNFFEHLPSKDVLSAVLREIHRLLRPGGRLLAMGPNIRYLPGAYWDFYDHHLPLSERSLEEGLLMEGFGVDRSIARFLPYTTRSALPQHPLLVALYLRMPILWPLFGKQFFVVATRKAAAPQAKPAP